jgi:predicted RNase H-like HicB family nuclease
MKYVYTAVLTPYDGGYVSTVPDVPGCTSGGKDLKETLYMTKDALSACLVTYEEENVSLSPARLPEDIPLEQGQIAALIDADTLQYRIETDSHIVRKNVSLPSWLNARAEKAGLNFSYELQATLREKLNLH